MLRKTVKRTTSAVKLSMQETTSTALYLPLKKQSRTLEIKFLLIKKQRLKEQSVKPKQNSLQSLWTKLNQRLKDYKMSLTALPSSCMDSRELKVVPVRLPVGHKDRSSRNKRRRMMETM